MSTLDVFFVVRSVFMILGKWSFRRGLVRLSLDLRLDAELGKVCENAGVKISHGQAVVQCKILDAAVACPHFQLVIFKIELDLKISSAERNGPCRKPSRSNIQRHMPPMVYPGMRLQAYLADHLEKQVQRIFCRPPGIERHWWKK